MANDPHFEVYPRKSQEDDAMTIDPRVGHAFGWRFRAANGQITAIGGEGFTRREDAHRAVRVVCSTIVHVATTGLVAAADVPIIDLDE